jgi:hypothetical protein
MSAVEILFGVVPLLVWLYLLLGRDRFWTGSGS